MNSAILSDESMWTSWPTLRNGCLANHGGHRQVHLNRLKLRAAAGHSLIVKNCSKWQYCNGWDVGKTVREMEAEA